MRRLAIMAVLAALAPPAHANDWPSRWSATDTMLEGAYVLAAGADWMQTRSHLGHGLELNPLLGAHPSRAAVDGYFAAGVVVHATVAYLLPRPWRSAWQAVWIGVEGHTVYRNWRAGVAIRF